MSGLLDAASVERAVQGLQLRVPRGPQRGRSGESRAASAGSSVELHDFRLYQPGDDLRQVDWNAVARTGDLVLRVRQEEVSPRCEVIVDGSASMGVTQAKARRTRELTYGVCMLAHQAGLEVSLSGTGLEARRHTSIEVRSALERLACDERVPFDVALARLPALRPCGLRIVVSDFLFEVSPVTLVERLARGASQLVLLQTLDAEDLEPTVFGGTRLIDSETLEAADRTLTQKDLELYQQRLRAHAAMWQGSAARVHGTWVQLSAALELTGLIRGPMSGLVEGTR